MVYHFTHAQLIKVVSDPTCEQLDLSHHGLTDDDIEAIADPLSNNSSLELILLGNNDITERGVSLLKRVRESRPNLTIVGVDWEPAKDRRSATGGGRHAQLIKVVSDPTCKQLDLSHHGLTDADIEAIAGPLSNNSSLELILLGNNDITERGVSLLKKVLESRPNLTIEGMDWKSAEDRRSATEDGRNGGSGGEWSR